MELDPVPAWYFLMTMLLVSSFCAWSSVRIMRIMQEGSLELMQKFGNDILDMCDRNDEDKLDQIEKLKHRVEWLERAMIDLSVERDCD